MPRNATNIIGIVKIASAIATGSLKPEKNSKKEKIISLRPIIDLQLKYKLGIKTRTNPIAVIKIVHGSRHLKKNDVIAG